MVFPGSLHNHTHYSNTRLRDCIIKETDLIDSAISLGHSAVAITDHDCLSGHLKALKYYRKVKKDHPDFKLILGNEIYLCRDGLNPDNFTTGDRYWHFILLAKDEEGHKQLRELSTRAWLRSYVARGMRRVPTYYSDLIDVIDNNKGHLIASTACLGSWLDGQCLELAKSWNEELAARIRSWCKQMVQLFGEGNFYIELQPPMNKTSEQYKVNQILLQFAFELSIPWIVTTDSHYISAEDREIHKAYLNSQNGEREVDSFYATTYMMDTEELEAHFDFPLQEAYLNIQKIIDMCGNDYELEKSLKIPHLAWKEFHPQTNPAEWVSRIPQLMNFITSSYVGDRELVKAIIEAIEKDERLQTKETYDAINDCLDKIWESSNVNKAHWSAYLLNLQKIIDCCWDAGSIVLPGRGSGVGFILLYLLQITQINPLWETVKTYSWRFLNPSRVSPLDVDFDIEGGRRAQVLSKFREVYGEDRVSNVITFAVEKSKSAILTAARGLGIDVDEAQYVASLVPADRGIIRTLDQCYYGDKENGFEPIRPFVNEMNARPELWKTAHKIENLICRTGIHAGGVIFVDEPFVESTALMRAPDGTIITAYELHDCEAVSLIKYDALSVNAADKIHTCLDLLIEDGLIEQKPTLKETYESVIGVYNLDRTSKRMWDMVNNHEIQSLFQMEKSSGIQGIALTHPQSVEDLAHLNSVIRLMAQDKDAEQPLQKYARFKDDIRHWYKEMSDAGLTEQDQKILKPYLEGSYGICESQELFMSLVQIPECGGFDLNFADRLRKSIAKKNPAEFDALTKEYFETTEQKGLSPALCNYVWNTLVSTSRGYGFNLSHTLAYSLVGLQEMNLASRFPIIYWNCACLITDAGSEDESADYSKIAKAIGKFKDSGVEVSLLDINKSGFGFKPDAANNRILYGLKGAANISDDFIKQIIANRPYVSMYDFYARVHPKAQQMVSLIKGGAFDSLEPRYQAMAEYVWLKCDKKKRITLQNLPGLIRYGLLPEDTAERIEARKFYEFTRYLKAECKYLPDLSMYLANDIVIEFLNAHDLSGLLIVNTESRRTFIDVKMWDKIYQKQMDVFRDWIASDKEGILNALNDTIFMEEWEKYGKGNLSSWEMDALCFYYHPHELIDANTRKYGISNYKDLPEVPVVERIYQRGNASIPIYRLNKICGTCIAKDKAKSTVYLLTTQGVVTVKFTKEYFSMFDRRISTIDSTTGKKKFLENSWFNRGSMIMVKGFRREDMFVSRNYAASPGHQLYRITQVFPNGDLELQGERVKGEAEEDDEV